MKKLLFRNPFAAFLATALFAMGVALIFKALFPYETFDLSIYNRDFSVSQSGIWFGFSIYLFFLALIYYTIKKTKLKVKHSLVIPHYIFIVMFLIFFAILSSFGNPAVQRLIFQIPLSTLISIYGIIFFVDALLFVFGIFLLVANLFSLKKPQD